MDNLAESLRRMKESDSDIALMLEVFRRADKVYRAGLEAMGRKSPSLPPVANTSKVKYTHHAPAPSSTTHK